MRVTILGAGAYASALANLLPKFLKNINYLPEGVYTLLALEKKTRTNLHKLPLMNMLLEILLERKNAHEALKKYMASNKED